MPDLHNLAKESLGRIPRYFFVASFSKDDEKRRKLMKNAESVYMYLTTRFTGDFLMCCTNDYLGRPSNNGQVMQIALMTDIRFQVKLERPEV